MNDTKQALERVLRSAAAAPKAPLVEMNLGLQNRVLDQLRSLPLANRVVAVSALWWRGALALCSVAVLAVALATSQGTNAPEDPYADIENVALEVESLALN